MITRGNVLPEKNGRKDYPLTSDEIAGRHFAVWTTTPGNPFGPHKHEQREIWFILDGQYFCRFRHLSYHFLDMSICQ